MPSKQPDSVCVAYLHSNEVAHSWNVSIENSRMFDLAGPQRLLRGGWIAQYGNEAGYDSARNKVAKEFLDNRDADWLWWVDSDMGWQPDALEQLMAVADPVDRPIVGGLCFGNTPTTDDGMNGQGFRIFPTCYAIDERDDKAGFSPIYGYPANEVIQVGGTGSAFVVIHRSVFAKIRERFGDTWYDRLPHPKNDVPFGEDLSFCLRAITCDIPIFVHTGVRTNHYKWCYLNETAYFQQLVAPPAIDEVAVVVPVINRPQNAAPFMATLRASTGLANCYAICELEDVASQSAWRSAGAEVIVEDARTFAEKVNVGYMSTVEPWVFITGDDVRFHPGWLDHAQQVARLHRADVIGTNDMSNPRVMAGQHATHMLIRRSYIDELGASWDGPGVLAHEGYGHWFVDDEIVTVAKQRGTFQAALGSIVEHLHPIAGKAETDEVYELGMSKAKDDKRLFDRRRAKAVAA